MTKANKEYIHALDEVLPMIDWINENHADCIKFVKNDSTFRGLSVYIAHNKRDTYTTMIISYGILFTLAAMEYYKFIEDYNRCAIILSAIKYCNEVYGCDLPTRLYSKWCRENRSLTPLQTLDRHFHKDK